MSVLESVAKHAENPLNWILGAAAIYLAYTIVAPQRPKASPRVYKPKKIELKDFTATELKEFNGQDGKDIYLAVAGRVYDVSAGRSFYGPGGMYGNFAGRDASRGLAKDSFDSDMITPDGEPIDKLDDLAADEKESLEGWAQFFQDSVTSGARSAIPDWLAKRKAKSLKHDTEWRNRIELIQDFQFPEASLKIKYTPDGNYILATGVYKPQIRIFDLAELTMKLDRHVDYENVDFLCLSDDWTKSVYLNTDRTIEFHTQFGFHYRTRIPRFGRALAYHFPTCDLQIVGSGSEIFRLNLDQGRFMNPLVTNHTDINTIAVNPAHGLIATGGDDGKIEFWHPSSRTRLADLDVAMWMSTVGSAQCNGPFDSFPAITSFEFGSDGLTFAAGTASGHVLLYDLRNPAPVLVKDHQYGLPIRKIHFHPSAVEGGKVMSADAKVIRIWSKTDGSSFTAIEPPRDINDFAITDAPSGLVMVANEGVDIQSYYIPELGPAPGWCPFLDNLTEEMEESTNATSGALYDDYKFVTRKELTRLGLDHLIGTSVLRAYMHGFFVDLRLYRKVKAIADPFEYEEHRKKMVEKKVEKQRGSRIHARRKLPTINKEFAIKIMKAEGEIVSDGDDSDDSDAGKKGSKKRKKATTLKKDDRFGAMFEDEDFRIDENSEEWRLRYPVEAKAKASGALLKFQKIDEDGNQSGNESGEGSADSGGDQDDGYDRPASAKAKGPSMYQLKDRGSAATDHNSTFGARAKAAAKAMDADTDRVVSYPGGNRSLSFTPGNNDRGSGLRFNKNSDSGDDRRKRGVGELRLKRLSDGSSGARGAGRGRGRGGRGRGASGGGGRGRGRGRGR